MPELIWTESQVREAIASSNNRCQVLLKLNAATNQTSYRRLETYIEKYGIPINNLAPKGKRGPQRKINHISPDGIGANNFWYVIGLIATDGHLSVDRKTVDITSNDKDFLEKIKATCDITTKILPRKSGFENGKEAWCLRTYHRNFYEYLQTLGLMNCKSFILGQLLIPDEYFFDFIRGVMDGNGSICKWLSLNDTIQWNLKITSAAINFINWLQQTLFRLLNIKGSLSSSKNKSGSLQYTLKYGLHESAIIAQKCYYPESYLRLERKFNHAQELIQKEEDFKKTNQSNKDLN